VTDRTAIVFGSLAGALVGAGASYLFFTEAGRSTRDRLEPAIDDLVREFQKFRGTLQKVGDMANDGLRAFNEFQQARQTDFPGGRTSH
jgi:gas vesicle protein